MMEKAEENKLIAEKCKAMGKYNAGASRAYYSAFQMAKYVLIQNKNYHDEFILKHGIENKDRYSHGRISNALSWCLIKKRKANQNELADLNVLDNLYHKRRKADYEEQCLNEKEMENSLKELDKVLAVLRTY